MLVTFLMIVFFGLGGMAGAVLAAESLLESVTAFRLKRLRKQTAKSAERFTDPFELRQD